MLLWLVITGFMQTSFAYDMSFCTTFKCPDLSESNIKCNFFYNDMDCLRSVNKNESQLGFAPFTNTYLAAQVFPNLEIVGDVWRDEQSSKWILEVVAVTNKPVSNFDELKGFTYCNTGLGAIPIMYKDGLERAILKTHMSPKCGTKTTFVEEQVCSLNEFFGPSCRAGLWFYNVDGSDTRKSDYTNLCQACSEDGCFVGEEAEDCLQLKSSAVTVTFRETIQPEWKPNYYYLCKNGTTSTKPCVWYSQSKSLIYTHKSLGESIRPKLNELLSICVFKTTEGCLFNLQEVLTFQKDHHVTVLNEEETKDLIPVVVPYKLDSSKRKIKRSPIRWCTVSDLEYEKCNWLKALSGILLYPINCVLKDSKESCIHAIENYDADMMEIVGMPIKDSMQPIAVSATPHSIYKNSKSPLELLCRDRFIHTANSELTTRSSSIFHYNSFRFTCPSGNYRHVCTNGTDEVCYYHSEVIMRKYDSNRENAKVLLFDITIIFKAKAPPFDFFGDFNGVPDLLLQSDTTDFYYIPFGFEFNRDDSAIPTYIKSTTYESYEHSTVSPFTKSIINIKPNPNLNYATSTTSNWSIFGISVVGALTVALCYALFKYLLRKYNLNQGYIRTST